MDDTDVIFSRKKARTGNYENPRSSSNLRSNGILGIREESVEEMSFDLENQGLKAS